MKSRSSKKNRQKQGSPRAKAPKEGTFAFPEHLKKDKFIYMDGVVESHAHQFFKVRLKNGIETLCTAKRLEHMRVGLMTGDKVVAELDPLNFSQGETTLKGRLVWRYKS